MPHQTTKDVIGVCRGFGCEFDKEERRKTCIVECQSISVDGSDKSAFTTPPALTHTLKHDKTILSLIVSSSYIFAGTEGGELLVYSLDTYQKKATIIAHEDSVLGLFLSSDESLLFTCAADHLVNVWDAKILANLYSIYSTYDIGDISCVAYSSPLETIYLGAQNGSIQWYDFKEKYVKKSDVSQHPYHRKNKFFDSTGPGGIKTPRLDVPGTPIRDNHTNYLQIDRQYYRPFAHFGYVYSMLLIKGIVTDDPEEETLITGSGDGSVKLWRILPEESGRIQELYELGSDEEDRESVFSLALDGTFLITGRLDGEVNIWDLETRQLVRTLKTKVHDVNTLCIGGGCLFIAGVNGKIEKFDSQYERAGLFQAHGGRILASAYVTSDRPRFITGGNDNKINIWDGQECDKSTILSVTSNEKLVDKLREFVSHRTVSSDPRYRAECRRGASFLRSVFKSFGAITELLAPEEANLNPVLYALFKGKGTNPTKGRRMLFYGHYDVIPAENDQAKWRSDPFRLEGIDDYLYGRGTSDNKGPIIAAIYAVAELIAEKSLESDIVFIIEGEEECGSRGFEQVVKKHKELIGPVDWILLANSYWLDDHVPCLTYGLRGVIHATLEVSSEYPDLHSGVEGSSLMDESLKDLILLLNSLTGRNGHIKLPGFYDPILPLTDYEDQLYKDITSALVERNPTLGDKESLATKLKQKWREASLTVHRFKTSGPENSTIIPRKASVAISLRLVPNQEADEISADLIEYLQEEFADLDTSNKLKIEINHKAEPWLGDYKNDLYKTLEEGIMQAWYGPLSKDSRHDSKLNGHKHKTKSSVASVDTPYVRRPLYIREGGSIPAIRFLEKEFSAPAGHLPCGQASDHAHLDNERLRLVNLYKSRDVFKWVFRELPKR